MIESLLPTIPGNHPGHRVADLAMAVLAAGLQKARRTRSLRRAAGRARRRRQSAALPALAGRRPTPTHDRGGRGARRARGRLAADRRDTAASAAPTTEGRGVRCGTRVPSRNLRTRVKSVELEAERLQQQELQALASSLQCGIADGSSASAAAEQHRRLPVGAGLPVPPRPDSDSPGVDAGRAPDNVMSGKRTMTVRARDHPVALSSGSAAPRA